METWMYWTIAGVFLAACLAGLLIYRRYGGLLMLAMAVASGLIGLFGLWIAMGQ